jgi:hypothetical protein
MFSLSEEARTANRRRPGASCPARTPRRPQMGKPIRSTRPTARRAFDGAELCYPNQKNDRGQRAERISHCRRLLETQSHSIQATATTTARPASDEKIRNTHTSSRPAGRRSPTFSKSGGGGSAGNSTILGVRSYQGQKRLRSGAGCRPLAVREGLSITWPAVFVRRRWRGAFCASGDDSVCFEESDVRMATPLPNRQSCRQKRRSPAKR